MDHGRADIRLGAPKYPIVLCHGLLGFDKLKAPVLPYYVTYWRGVAEALQSNGAEVITTSVPATGSIEERSEVLMKDIEKRASGKKVNLIGYGKCRGPISSGNADETLDIAWYKSVY